MHVCVHIVEVLYLGYRGPLVMARLTNLNMVRFLPTTHGWRTQYLVSDMAPPLWAKGEGPPTYKN
jgi:hypothetical protein